MEYQELPPPPELAGHVRCTWSLRSDAVDVAADPEPILPDGLPELIVHHGTPWHEWVDGHWVPQPPLFLVGQLTRVLRLRPVPGTTVIGVRFLPHAAGALFSIDMSAITDGKLVLNGPDAPLGGLHDDLTTLPDTGACMRLVIDRVKDLTHAAAPLDDAVAGLVDAITTDADGTALAALKARTALSERQLERRFLRAVGMRPKAFQRIIRIRRAVDHMHDGRPRTLAELAHAAGYMDQSHFNRDLKAFTGMSPRAWFGQQLVLPAYLTGAG